MTKPFCPHCGYDLHFDAPIILNDYSMLGQYAPFCYLGNSIQLTGFERSLCWSLMKAYPHPVRLGVLLDRMGSDGIDNTVNVFVCRIRKKLKAVGAPDPFKATNHHGCRAYTWVLGGGHAVDREAAAQA